MDPQESKTRFKRADRRYRAGRYKESLVELQALDEAFPGNQDVLFAAARCYAKMGRDEQALRVCNRLIREHNHRRAELLKEKVLSGADTDTMAGTLDVPPDGATEPPASDAPEAPARDAGPVITVLPSRPARGPAWLPYLLFGAVSLIAIGMAGVLSSQFTAGRAAGTAAVLALGIVFLLVNYLALCMTMYSVLSATKSLLHDKVQDDMLDVALYAFIVMVLAATCLGLLAIPFLLARHYELSSSETVTLLGAIIGAPLAATLLLMVPMLFFADTAVLWESVRGAVPLLHTLR